MNDMKSENSTNALAEEIAELQKAFGDIDLLLKPRDFSPIPQFLVRVLEDIKIRMDGSKNHRRPHIHIDYGRKRHTASYAIDTGEKLVGSLGSQYDRRVLKWIDEYRPKLMMLWENVQTGGRTNSIISELRSNSRARHPHVAISASVTLSPVAGGRLDRDNTVMIALLLGIHNENHAIHALPIGGLEFPANRASCRRLTMSDRHPTTHKRTGRIGIGSFSIRVETPVPVPARARDRSRSAALHGGGKSKARRPGGWRAREDCQAGGYE